MAQIVWRRKQQLVKGDAVMTTIPRPPIDNNPAGVDSTVKIRRGRVDCVTLYEVGESELDQLEAGSPATVQLNFAIFCLSVSLMAITSLVTADFKSEKWMYVYILGAIVCMVLGGFFLISWVRNKNSIQKIISRIRQRVQAEPQSAAIVKIASADSQISADVALVHSAT